MRRARGSEQPAWTRIVDVSAPLCCQESYFLVWFRSRSMSCWSSLDVVLVMRNETMDGLLSRAHGIVPWTRRTGN